MMPIFMPSSWLPTSIEKRFRSLSRRFGGASDVGAPIQKASESDAGWLEGHSTGGSGLRDHQLHAAFS
jgi:hypothetical protein